MSEQSRDVPLPSLAGGASAARIVEWAVEVGDRLVIDRPLCIVEPTAATPSDPTDTTDLDDLDGTSGPSPADGPTEEIVSPVAGLVTNLAAEPGETIPVGHPLVTVDLDWPPPAVEDGPPSSGGRPRPSPLVRRLAAEFGVDLATVDGTGPEGRVTRDDVHRAAFPDEPLPGTRLAGWDDATQPLPLADLRAHPPAGDDGPAPTAGGPTSPGSVADRPLDLTDGPAETTAGRAAVTGARTGMDLSCEADAGQLLVAHQRLSAESGRRITFDALLMKLVAAVLPEFPELATEPAAPVIGFVRAGDQGVVGAAITGAVDQSLTEVDVAMNELMRRRSATAEGSPALTIVDAGPLLLTALTPPLGSGVAVVAFGSPRAVVSVVDGTVQTGQVMTVTGSFDGALIDLARAAAFLGRLRTYLEDPILAFVG